jgi:hypothetical protein
MVMIKYVLLWFPMLLLAIANGTLRDLGYRRYTGILLAHQISTVTLIVFFAFYIHYIIQRFPPSSQGQALLIGLLWLLLTLCFEFGFGRLRGNSWMKLLEDYNLLKGRIWIFIPIWILIAPYLFYRLHK